MGLFTKYCMEVRIEYIDGFGPITERIQCDRLSAAQYKYSFYKKNKAQVWTYESSAENRKFAAVILYTSDLSQLDSVRGHITFYIHDR